MKSITQDDDFIDFEYRHDGNRISEHSFDLNTNSHIKSKYFSSDYEKVFYSNGDIKEISYVPFTNGQVVLVKITGGTSPSSMPSSDKVYYPTYDYLGSLISIANDDLSIIENYSYDPWGRLRDVTDYNNLLSETNFTYFNLLDRGFTGHEHLPTFKLINMNGRVYDPILGQFIQPDNNITFPENSNGYNRYAYAMNNPLKFTDPNGEIPILAAMLVGGLMNTMMNIQNINDIGDLAGYFGIGAAASAVGAGIGGGINAALFGKSFTGGVTGAFTAKLAAPANGFINGALVGFGSGAASGFITGFGNASMQGDKSGSKLEKGGIGALIGGILSGISTGVSRGNIAEAQGRNYWTAEIKEFKWHPPLLAINSDVAIANPEGEWLDFTLINDSQNSVVYTPEQDYKIWGMKDGGAYVLRPGHSIKVPIDGVATECGTSCGKIFKVPGQDNWLFPNPQVKIVFGGNIRIRGLQAMFMADSWEIFSSGLDFIPFFEFTPYRWGCIPVSNFEQGSKFRNIFEKLLEISK